MASPSTNEVRLRDVADDDLAIFFEHQRDPVSSRMAAFTAEDPSDRNAFAAKWAKILGDRAVTKRTILVGGRVAGNVLSFIAPGSGRLEISYWLGREYWGRGVATRALSEFLRHLPTRPLYARAAKDNGRSLRVLEKCGFTIVGEDKGFAHARGDEVGEFVLELTAGLSAPVVLSPVAELSDADREAVRLLALAVYPPGQFADWPGRHVQWTDPEWCVRVRGERGALASYVGVYVRRAECDGRPVSVGGIGNVKTHPAERRRGLAALAIRRAVDFFHGRQSVDFALLVCEPDLAGYYARLGWREFGGRLLVRQHGEACAFTLNRVMTRGVLSEPPASGTIDLCGPPW